MRALLTLAKGLLSIVSFAGSLVRFVVYIAFALDIAALFICGFGYFIAFLIPIAVIWAIPVVAGGLIDKCDEGIRDSKENAYYEKMYRKSNDYKGTRHESHYENYYDNIGYHYRGEDYKITNGRNHADTDSPKTSADRKVNYTPRPESCKAIYEEVHASK